MLNHAGPTLMACGTDEQKAYHLPKILNGDVLWCQGFSEPGSGSDLGSLKCRGEVDGDEIVINGTKIWSSFADVAEWQELLIRTNPGASTSKALSWVIRSEEHTSELQSLMRISYAVFCLKKKKTTKKKTRSLNS